MAYSSTLKTYLESEVLNADPVQLVSLLYRGALEAVGAARQHLADGDIPARSARIMKAWDILAELLTSLKATNPENAAAEAAAPGDTNKTDAGARELAAQLHDLYGYMQQRLLDANAQQSDAPLAEVASLLTTLAEAWSDVAANPEVAAQVNAAREAEARSAAESAREAILPASGGGSAGSSACDLEPTGYEDYRPLRVAL